MTSSRLVVVVLGMAASGCPTTSNPVDTPTGSTGGSNAGTATTSAADSTDGPGDSGPADPTGVGSETDADSETGGVEGLCADAIGPDSATLNAEVQALMATNHHPGVAICTTRGAQITWCRGYGKANLAGDVDVTARTPFLIASVSKLFTATALMQLWEDGEFELDDDVDASSPFPARHPTSKTAVTYRMLLAHASSIEDSAIADMFYEYGSDPTISLLDAVSGYLDPDGVYYTNDNWAAGDPGTAASYSNIGYAFAGLLTQLHTGTDFADRTEATILAPLGMEDSAWRLADHDLDTIAMAYAWEGGQYQEYGHYTFADYPNGGLRGSACDVALFLSSQAAGGEPILAPATLATMQEITYPMLDDVQGLGWYFEDIGPGNWIGHSGGEQGIFTEAFYRTSDGVGFVLLTNAAGDDENLLFDLEGSIIEWAESL